jgi:hypothetical protein
MISFENGSKETKKNSKSESINQPEKNESE